MVEETTKAVQAADQTEAKTAPANTDNQGEKAASPAPRKTARKAAAAKRRPATQARTARKPAKAGARRKTATAGKTRRNGANRSNGVETMTKQTRNAADANFFAADQFADIFGDVNSRTRQAAERSAKLVEELADLTRGNVEALVASTGVAAKAVESLSRDAAEYSRRSFEEASSALKSFAGAKSTTDFFRMQSDFARAAFDSAVAENARMSEQLMKFAGDVAEPITNRYTVAAERAKTLAA